MDSLKVCFIGHRKITASRALTTRLTQVIVDLIAHGADTFLFGSRSQFDRLCWGIVTKLKSQFPAIKSVRYHTPHETALASPAAAQRLAKITRHLGVAKTRYPYYDMVVASAQPYRQTYIIRNQIMIDASDVCVYYYDQTYQPPRRPTGKHTFRDYQPHSGTALAYQYAKRRHKRIINVCPPQ